MAAYDTMSVDKSYDLRTLMNTIIGVSEVQLQSKALPKDIRNAFDMIRNSAYSLKELLKVEPSEETEPTAKPIAPDRDSEDVKPKPITMIKEQFTRDYMPYGKVMIVDDMRTNLYVAKGLMEPYGLTVETVSSGQEAIDRIRGGHVYDIIFMDIAMPEMNGTEATQIIRSTGYGGAVIAFTANINDEMAIEYMENGFDGFIPKPIDIRELNTMLNALIRDKQPPEVVVAASQEMKESVVPAEKIFYLPYAIKSAFIRDTSNAIATLDILYAKFEFGDMRDINLYTTTILNIKNALDICDDIELAILSQELENASRGRDFALLISKTPALIDKLRSLMSKVRTARQSEDDDIFEGDGEYLAEHMQVILAACDTFDKATIKASLTALEQKKWCDRTEADLDAIAIHLLHSAFTKAATVANEVLKRGM